MTALRIPVGGYNSQSLPQWHYFYSLPLVALAVGLYAVKILESFPDPCSVNCPGVRLLGASCIVSAASP